jgi:hypothetical protein
MSLIYIIFVFSGCMTILFGRTQKVRITSDPYDAHVAVYDKRNKIVGETFAPDYVKLYKSYTPSTGTIDSMVSFNRKSLWAFYCAFKRATYRIEISKEGYQTAIVYIKSRFNVWCIGNLLSGLYVIIQACLDSKAGTLNPLLLWAIPYMIIPPILGSLWDLYPQKIYVQLKDVRQVINEQ